MQINIQKGLLLEARQHPSPNYNDRPLGVLIDLLVIHNISLPPGEFGGSFIDAFFTNSLDPTLHPYFPAIVSLRVSSHCLIRRDGNIVQYVPFDKRAWHAGASHFRAQDDCNDFAIGIELEGTDEIPYTEIQYQTLANLIKTLQIHYPEITQDRIVGHSTIAPDRKTDPGESFNWELLAYLLNRTSEKLV